jgi:pimeloyl-ACP methyl ester carboxylesterase
MKLAYLDRPLDAPGPAAVLLHREGINSTKDVLEFAHRSGLFSRLVVPTGEYAFYPSGMSIGGTCWYRILPGFEGTDPISLTTAVIEVADLLGDLALDRPVLVGWGQGAVVALATGVWQTGAVRAIVCVDPSVSHLELLPPAVLAAANPAPVLLVAADAEKASELERQEKFLASHTIGVTSWCWEGEGTKLDFDQALADRIGRWMDHE